MWRIFYKLLTEKEKQKSIFGGIDFVVIPMNRDGAGLGSVRAGIGIPARNRYGSGNPIPEPS